MTNGEIRMTKETRHAPSALVIRASSFVILLSFVISDCLLSRRLARLDLHVFALVSHAFAFVRLGLAERAELGGELADHLLVGALNDDVGSVWASHREPRGNLSHQLVGQSD